MTVRATPTPAAAPAATPTPAVALTGDALIIATILAAIKPEDTAETVVETVTNNVRTIKVANRPALHLALFDVLETVPGNHLRTIRDAITNAPFGNDPKVRTLETLTASVRQTAAMLIVAVEMGVTLALPVIPPTDDELAAAREKFTRAASGRSVGGASGATREKHVAKVLPKGQYSIAHANGVISLAIADGKTPDRITFNGKVQSLSAAAVAAKQTDGKLTQKDANGWVEWVAGKTGVGETAATVGAPVAAPVAVPVALTPDGALLAKPVS